MKFNSSFCSAAAMTLVLALSLTACESMNSAWNDITGDDAEYAGTVQPTMPQQQQAQTQQPMQMMPPQQMQQPVIPQTAMQPQMQQQAQMPMQQPVMPVTNYAPNLATVPARPTAAEMPNQQQVQMARADLNADNRRAMGYLRDPNGAAAPQMAQQSMPMQQPMAQQMPMMSPAVSNAPAQQSAAPQYTAPAAMMTNADQLMGLQQTAPGKYALAPVTAEAPLGGFALTSSLMYAPGNDQVSMPQYQELRRVAGQYAQQPGRVRVISYSDAQNSQQALQRATTAAAYLVDLGVPANAIRVKVDSSAVPTSPASAPVPSKTDIFLETPQAMPSAK